jgi:hypothetical protein
MDPVRPTSRVVRDDDLATVDSTRLTDVVNAFTVILGLPQSAITGVDALAVPTGQGEQWRLTHAIGLWQANPRLRRLLVADGNPAERTYAPLTLDRLRDLGLRRLDGVHLQPRPAPNTGLQAGWIADQVRRHGITSLALAVSAYHLPRVYLTVLKALERDGVRIPLIPAPVPICPDTPVPETGATAYDLVAGEAVRIIAYADEGRLATPAELRRYLRWLWRDHEALLLGSPT